MKRREIVSKDCADASAIVIFHLIHRLEILHVGENRILIREYLQTHVIGDTI